MRKSVLLVIVWAALLGSGLTAWADLTAFYATGGTGGLYRIDTSPGLSIALTGQIRNSSGAALTGELALDCGPDGNLYMYNYYNRRVGDRTYRQGTLYQLDHLTGTAAREGPTVDLGSFGYNSDPRDGGLAFHGNGKYYTAGRNPDTALTFILENDPLPATTSVSRYRVPYAYTFFGLQWYDNGTPEGLLLGLQGAPAGGSFSLQQVTLTSPMGFSVSPYAAVPAAGGMTLGDLSLYNDTLYLLLSGSGSSNVYSYDVLQGPYGAFADLGTLNVGNLTSLAAWETPHAVPLPPSVLLAGMGLCISARFLRRPGPFA